MANKDPFLNKDFLKELDQERQRVIYVKIISLDFNENPLEEIQGRVTGGNINVNGESSLRRTCSVSLVAQELNIHDFYWGLNSKFKLYIGLQNDLNDDYPNIIWFKQGTYIINSFSTSQNTSNYTVSISGQDKMCLLNGTIGGSIYSLTADFGKIEEVDEKGNVTITDIPLKDIIREGVHEYAREPWQNIIINDLDEVGLELLEYRGDTPMYFIRNVETDEVSNMFMDGTRSYQEAYKDKGVWKTKGTITLDDPEFKYDHRIDFLDNDDITYVADENGNHYSVFKVTFGEVIGFKETDLTYPGDLIGKVGNSFCQGCLDPIVKMLGDFEYYYDIDGRFHFQRKRTFVNVAFNNIMADEDSGFYVAPSALTTAVTYSFENANLISSYANTPNLSNLKNDFSIWGSKTTTGGKEYPIHLRYAIDKKPYYYKNYEGQIFTTGYRTLDFMKEEYLDLEAGISTNIKTHVKAPLPNGLNYEGSLWWDMADWADLYYRLSGEYPSGGVGKYAQGYDHVDLEYYFPGGNTHWDKSWSLHIFDVNNTADGNLNGPLRSVVHNPYRDLGDNPSYPNSYWCGHDYMRYFVTGAREGGYHSYIYNPVFPSEELQEAYEKELLKEENAKWRYYLTYHNYNCDWREIIYQMAKDYLKHGHDKDFLYTVAKNNREYYPTGETGYEMYYTDLVSFWRELYNPNYDYTYTPAYVTASMYIESPENYFWFVQCDENTRYDSEMAYYIIDHYGNYEKRDNVLNDIKENPNINNTYIFKYPENFYYVKKGDKDISYDPNIEYYTRTEGDYNKERYIVLTDGTVTSEPNPNFGWNTSITEFPQNLNFWFDFLDSVDGKLSQYSVRNVGDRPKAENNSNVKAIYYRDTPNVIFIDSEDWADEIDKQKALKPGYTFVQYPNYMDALFTLSTQKQSAKEALDDFLYQYTYCTESITVQALPVYYLEPNTRIFLHDDNSGLEGEYIVNKISYQLTYNGMMTINAVKAVDRIY